MRCINTIGGFQLGFELTADDSGDLLLASGRTIVARLPATAIDTMQQLGHVAVDNMVVAFTANKAARARSCSKVTVDRVSVNVTADGVVFGAETDSNCPDFLVLLQSDHLRYPHSGFTALDGAEVLHTLPDYGQRQTVMLARVPPGSSLRGYIDEVEGRLKGRRQYISNLALSPDGREFISHG